ncbi:hypothetical protein [Haliscomenobacter sp.]|uniref:hypothetical protein n=1 Tax=Haliscomenobacter sp. TaxID=2717303 RepID=UPI0033652BF3
MSVSVKFSFFSNERPEFIYLDLFQMHILFHVSAQPFHLPGRKDDPGTNTVARHSSFPAYRINPHPTGEHA